jgi:hypothetical protein
MSTSCWAAHSEGRFCAEHNGELRQGAVGRADKEHSATRHAKGKVLGLYRLLVDGVVQCSRSVDEAQVFRRCSSTRPEKVSLLLTGLQDIALGKHVSCRSVPESISQWRRDHAIVAIRHVDFKTKTRVRTLQP